MQKKNIIIASLVFCSACAVQDQADDAFQGTSAPAGESMPGAPSNTTVPPTPPLPYYEVPTSEALAAYAVFPVPGLELDIRATEAKLEYDLPLALTGLPIEIELTGTYQADGSDVTLYGEHGVATCTPGERFECFVEYEILLDADATAAWLKQNVPSAERALRTEVARVFRDDPLGILHGVPQRIRDREN